MGHSYTYERVLAARHDIAYRIGALYAEKENITVRCTCVGCLASYSIDTPNSGDDKP